MTKMCYYMLDIWPATMHDDPVTSVRGSPITNTHT